MTVFGPDELDEIIERALKRRLHDEPRSNLFRGVLPEYFDRLKRYDNDPRNQLISDVTRMNDDGALGSEHFPLLRWLSNARFALSAYPDDQLYFREKHDKAAAWRDAQAQAPKVLPGGAPMRQKLEASREEDILFESDLLPIGFIRGAERTARAVGRIEVPRFISAMPQTPGSAGTGWLIGAKHVITNYHVVKARVKGEGDPTEGDLRLQADSAKIAFDYDDETTNQPRSVSFARLCAWDKALDYAILELAEASAAEPLPLLDKTLTLDESHRLQVNIIQHPGGFAKQIAIRNNLAVTIDGPDLAYYTDTDKGSSGSPVCDDEWRVVALHKATTRMFGTFHYQGKDTAWINIGTPIKLIIDHLRGHADPAKRQLWGDIGATLVDA